MTPEPITKEELDRMRSDLAFRSSGVSKREVFRLIAEVERLREQENLWALSQEINIATVKQLVDKRDSALAKLRELGERFRNRESYFKKGEQEQKRLAEFEIAVHMAHCHETFAECAQAAEEALKKLSEENK